MINTCLSHTYKYLGNGLVHEVYEKSGKALKKVKNDRKMFMTESHFNREIVMNKILRDYGFPVIEIYGVVFDKNLGNFVLEMEYVNEGIQYDEDNIPVNNIDSILLFLWEVAQIPAANYGELFGEKKELIFANWTEFLCKQYTDGRYFLETLDEYSLYWAYKKIMKNAFDRVSRKEQFNSDLRILIMDPNPNNFFFKGKKIYKAIDIDHPIGGDPLWQWACIRWFKPTWYKRLFTLGILDIAKDIDVFFYTVIFGACNGAFMKQLTGDIDRYVLKRMEELLFEADLYEKQ